MIEQLVSITDQKAVTTSLIVAEAFEKQHKDVMRAISRVECSEEFNRRNFAPISYIDDRNRPQPAYQITRDGFTFLAMGFTGKRAAEFKEKFIASFNRMEQALLEGQGDRRQVDVNLKHERGITNPHGLDVKYTLDLTKIAMNPTRRNLAVLERITGIPMSDIIPEPTPTSAEPDYVPRFVEACCYEVDPGHRIPFKRFYDHFRRWYALEVDAGHAGLPSKIMVGKALRRLGHDTPNPQKTGGQLFVCGLELADQGGPQ